MKGPVRFRAPNPGVPRLAPAPPAGAAPSSVTFFVTAAQRRAILARLRKVHRDRAAALLAALGIDRTGDHP